MKKYAVLFALTLCLCFSLTACSSYDDLFTAADTTRGTGTVQLSSHAPVQTAAVEVYYNTAVQCPEPSEPEVSARAYAAFTTGRELFNDGKYYDAVPYLQVAAEGGHILGGRLYAWCLLYGKGTNPNPRAAVFYFDRAARDGDAEAQYELGYCYYAGEGVQRDYETAAYWYAKSAEQGNRHGLLNLGYCYEKGFGVPQNYETARELYIRAQQAGNSNAAKRLHDLEMKMFG